MLRETQSGEQSGEHLVPNESIPAQFGLMISALSDWIQMRAEGKGTFAKPLYGQKLFRWFDSLRLRQQVSSYQLVAANSPKFPRKAGKHAKHKYRTCTGEFAIGLFAQARSQGTIKLLARQVPTRHARLRLIQLKMRD